MPHQCLNCGRIIEKGSDEILKGCAQCGGKKFMFVDTPLPPEQRENLKRKAEEVRDEMLQKADPEFLEILKQRGMGDLDGTHVEVSDELGEDWVKVRMDKGEAEIEQGEGVSSYEVISPTGSRSSARDLISRFDMEIEEKKRSRTSESGEGKHPSESKIKAPASRKGSRKRRRKREAPKEEDVNVINILEHGVYEIDVKRLLEDNPIVIQKDGSYLIHLPSLFKEGREKAKK